MLELLGIWFLIILIGEYEHHKHHKHIRTSSLAIHFYGGTMSVPATNTGTTAIGVAIFALLFPLQANGSNSNGAVSNAAWTITDNTIASISAQGAGATSGVVYAGFNALKIGSTGISVTATVTDPDGTVSTFTATGTIVVTAGANDVLTASLEILFSATVPA